MAAQNEGFSCIEEIGHEFRYLLNSPDGFEYNDGVDRCKELGSELTSITSEEEYNLILNFSFDFGIEQDFIIVNENSDFIRTWIGLTLDNNSGIIGFEDDSDTSFFNNFGEFPWFENNPILFDNNEIFGAVFEVNKLNTTSENLFLVDSLDITYGIICRRPSASCGENIENNRTDEEGLISIDIYIASMIGVSILLLTSVVLLLRIKKKNEKIINGSRYKSELIVNEN